MKKILTYILILITLTLSVIPLTKVNAYDTTIKGKCTIRAYPVGVEETDWLDYTEAQCHADTYPDKKDANAEFVKWTAYSADCVKPLSRSSTDGSCVCQSPWGVMKDNKCVDPASITCTSTNPNVPTGCTPAATNPPATQNTNYTFLAPLPCDPADNTLKGVVCDPVKKTLTSFDPKGEGGNLGTYLNIMIKIFIGICAVLAVIMIIMGGLEYMTSELAETKTHGKHRIMNALWGLVLAVGAWTILYTINPRLLDTDLTSLGNVTVEVTLADETENPEDAVTGGGTTGATTLCPEGIKQTQSGIFACGRIADKLDQMISAAKTAGYNISGGGYRSIDQQKALRVSHCNGNTDDPKAKCTPPTAIPGASRHNHALAIDFTCDRQLIRTPDNKCFVWLKNNANSYGFRNLASEPWHWSIDGR